MLKKIIAIALLCGLPIGAQAAQIVVGTITNVAAGVDNIAVHVNAAAGSPCPSGWFYSFTTDSDDASVNRLLATILVAYNTGAMVSFYWTSAACNQGTNSRFTSLQTQ